MNYKTLADYQPQLINDTHFPQIEKWLNAWNIPITVLDGVSKTGLIIEDVCAIWLYETNSKLCFVDGLISNKNINDKLRSDCVSKLLKYMYQLAYNKGFKYMQVNTKLSSVKNRAEDMGFVADNNVYYILSAQLRKI